jgi:hypothetical protein
MEEHPVLQLHRIARTTVLTAAIAAAFALPASSAPPAGPKTQIWIDLATHGMAGMPDLGILGGFAGRMMGGDKGPQGYPQSRGMPATTGKLLDVAMYNSLKPGAEAQQLVPAGLGMGKSLPLLAPVPQPNQSTSGSRQPIEMEVTVRQYWGCGATVRPGQPKVLKMKVANGEVQSSGALAPGLFVPERDIDAVPPNVVWPNRKNTKRVSDRSSMVGQYQIVGDGVPESLKFELGRSADFMPKIALETQGKLADPIVASWQPVERSQAYFLSATAMQDQRNFVTWSSSEVAGAGSELLNYLTGSYVERWLKQKVLLPASTTSCTVPKGIFNATGNGQVGMAALTMIAYGPETNIAWPPKPADSKAPWNPEWNVRVRSKSTSTAMLGMDLSGMGAGPADGNGDGKEQPQEKEGKGKKLLKGLLRNF